MFVAVCIIDASKFNRWVPVEDCAMWGSVPIEQRPTYYPSQYRKGLEEFDTGLKVDSFLFRKNSFLSSLDSCEREIPGFLATVVEPHISGGPRVSILRGIWTRHSVCILGASFQFQGSRLRISSCRIFDCLGAITQFLCRNGTHILVKLPPCPKDCEAALVLGFWCGKRL